MNDALFGHPPDLTFPVDYTAGPGRPSNADFRGKGMLAIQQEGPERVFVFSGADRASFVTDRYKELSFREQDIWNVEADGNCVSFSTTVGRTGAKSKSFVFCCPTEEQAFELAAALPSRKDRDFVAAEDFLDRLRSLPGARSPWGSVTNVIIGLNVLAFIAMGLKGAGWFEVESMEPYIRYGANRAGVTTHGQWWRIVACMFLHYGILHLAFNMWALYQSGHLLERLLGRSLFTLTYFASGIVGSFTTLIWHTSATAGWSAGASGAVFGTFGALIGYMLREKHALPRTVFQPLLKSCLAFTAYNIVFGLAIAKVDNAAHIGGLAGGLVFGWLVALPVDAEIRARKVPARLIQGVFLLCWLVAIGVVLALKYSR